MALKEIITGEDPRNIDEFSQLRQEINKINHPEHPKIDWSKINTLSLQIFKINGIDLQTAIYYTLAKTKKDGLAGFAEGCEILAALVHYQWQNMWPKPNNVRADMFEWLNGRISPDIRRIEITAADHPIVASCKDSLETIKQAFETNRINPLPRFVFLLDFINDTNDRLIEEHKHQTEPKEEPEILVYQPQITPKHIEQKTVDSDSNKTVPKLITPQVIVEKEQYIPSIKTENNKENKPTILPKQSVPKSEKSETAKTPTKLILLFSLCIILLLLLLVTGCSATRKTKSSSTPLKSVPIINETSYCVGPYMLSLPANMKKIHANYKSKYLQVSTYSQQNKYRKDGLLHGSKRLKNWLDSIEQNRLAIKEHSTQYVLKDIIPQLKTVVYYYNDLDDELDLTIELEPEKLNHHFAYFLFKDFPTQNLGIQLREGEHFPPITFADKDFVNIFEKRASLTKQQANLVEYHRWPHTSEQFCIDNEFTLNIHSLSNTEYYVIQFANSKNSRLEIMLTGTKSAEEIAIPLKQKIFEKHEENNTITTKNQKAIPNTIKWISTTEKINKKTKEIAMDHESFLLQKEEITESENTPLLTMKKIIQQDKNDTDFNPEVKIRFENDIGISLEQYDENKEQNSYITIAGQSGILTITQDKQTKTLYDFYWESPKNSTVEKTTTLHISIKGSLDTKDDKKITTDNITKVITQLLTSIKIR